MMTRVLRNLLVLSFCVSLVTACSGGYTEEAEAYRQFMDFWIVQDYVNALGLTTGKATSRVKPKTQITSKAWGKTVKLRPGGLGEVGGSKVEVVTGSRSGSTVELEVVYSASVSYPGAYANPMSPKSWKHYKQKVSMVNLDGTWKVEAFSGEGVDDR